MDEATTAVLDQIKRRLSIDDSSFDDDIEDFITAAVARLYPMAQQAIPAQVSNITVNDFGEVVLALGSLETPLDGVRKVEGSCGFGFSSLTNTYLQDADFYIREVPSNTTSLRIYGLKRYEAFPDVPPHLVQAIIWYAMSEFYDTAAAKKGHYNSYMASGARDVDNMRDQSDYYEQKANVYLNDRATTYGIS